MSATHSWPFLKPEKSNWPAVALVSGTATTCSGIGGGGIGVLAAAAVSSSSRRQRRAAARR